MTMVFYRPTVLERAHIESAENARGDLQKYLAADPPRGQEVKGHMANVLRPQADVFQKKPRASTWGVLARWRGSSL